MTLEAEKRHSCPRPPGPQLGMKRKLNLESEVPRCHKPVRRSQSLSGRCSRVYRSAALLTDALFNLRDKKLEPQRLPERRCIGEHRVVLLAGIARKRDEWHLTCRKFRCDCF